jgi:protein O-GlcNAc transferase
MSAVSRAALLRLEAGDREGALAVLAAPADAEEHAVRGMALLAAERYIEARAVLAQALALGDASGPTRLNLAIAEDRSGADGRTRMRALAAEFPNWDEPPLRLAESYRRSNEPVPAIDAYEWTLRINPDRAEALLGLAALRLAGGDAAAARLLLLRCCAVAPQRAEAWDALGLALRALDEPAAAEQAAAEAQRLRPQDHGFALRRAAAALAAGTAEAELARLTAADPLNVAAATARGALLHALGRIEEAVGVLEAAAALAPNAPEPAAALAEALLKTPRLNEAVTALRRATALAPGDLALRNNLAAALTRQHRYREARRLLEALLAEHGEHPALLCNLSNALVLLGRQAEGVAAARRATELAPEMHLAWRTLGAAAIYAEGASAAELRAIAERASATLTRTAPPPPRASGPERRLRVGLLSTKLRTHPVGWLTVAAFEALDRTGFEIVGLAGPVENDVLERRFRAAAAEWHVVATLPPEGIAALARALGIDVLIDLGGWGDDGLMTACAQRPAPVQIKWVGNQAYTTGLAEIDWMLTDRWETPEGFERFYTERLLRLPDGYVCYSPPVYAPEVAPLPALARGHVTFGCFNNLAKITPAVIAAWAAILRRVPNARMVVKAYQFADPETAAEVTAAFAAHGVDAARLDLRGASGHRAHLAQHGEVDIVLDPFPYAGGLTTCEALWMGVPVVTLAGETFAGRHSASHLHNCGLRQFVAGDSREYEEIAVAQAADVAALARLRAELRERVAASPLCDAPRFARNLAAALRAAWREACTRR